MTDDDLKQEVHDLAERIEGLEEEGDRLRRLPDAVSRLEGAVSALARLVTTRFDNVDRGVKKASGWDLAYKFAIGVLVPLAVALITGYFLLKSQLVAHPVSR